MLQASQREAQELRQDNDWLNEKLDEATAQSQARMHAGPPVPCPPADSTVALLGRASTPAVVFRRHRKARGMPSSCTEACHLQVLRSELASSAGTKQHIVELEERMAAELTAGRSAAVACMSSCFQQSSALAPQDCMAWAFCCVNPEPQLDFVPCFLGVPASHLSLVCQINEELLFKTTTPNYWACILCREREDRWRQQLEDQQATAASQAQVRS